MDSHSIRSLKGPILVLGASGFVGANLFKMLCRERSDVYGTASSLPAWRLSDIEDASTRERILTADLRVDVHLRDLFATVRPQTVFNCLAYGAYSFETEAERILETNLTVTLKILNLLEAQGFAAYVHAGSSSEYGDNCAAPREDSFPLCNSHYSVSKISSAFLLQFYGRRKNLPVCNLRLYSVYGPLEDASRLFPNLIHNGLEKKFPPFVNKDISRDYVYVDDVCAAFIHGALYLKPEHFGSSFNIGTGQKTSMVDLALAAKEVFDIDESPKFGAMEARKWDVTEWYSDPSLAMSAIHWKAEVKLTDGLRRMASWVQSVGDWKLYESRSKKYVADRTYSVSAIVACYRDGQAIPYMHERLTNVFKKTGIDYEIIFVNDNSPDNSEDVIREISARDHHVLGISHSRNFGSQAAFKSGMDIASKNACVLLDGDLQDPPELIEKFVEKWKSGFDVVYGVRIKREAPLYMQFAYKIFYRLFDYFSYIKIPRDAGDFSLIDRKVFQWLLSFPERDLFLRGIRAYAGFKQVGVDYVRPERMFGTSTNNLFKNIGWAKKAIFSFSYAPLNMLSFFGVSLFLLTVLLSLVQVALKFFYPEFAPQGITTVMLLVAFFGSVNLLAVALIGEYIAKIFEESKRRPVFIRRSLTRDGETRTVHNFISQK